MRLYLSAALTALVVSHVQHVQRVVAQTKPASPSCLPMTDPDNKLVQSVAMMANVTSNEVEHVPLDAMFGSLESVYPWLTTCVASIDITQVMVSVMSNPRVMECQVALDSAKTEAPPMSDEWFADFFCPTFKDTVVPCINDVLLKTLTDIMDNSEGCCNGVTAKFTELYGYGPQDMVRTLLQHASNIACSEKAFKVDGKTQSQKCGQSLLATIMPDMEKGVTMITQLPNAQACAAMNGDSFKITNGTSMQMQTIMGEPRVDSCYQPVDDLFKHMSKWPVMQQPMTAMHPKATMAQMFTEDTCVPGAAVLDMMLDKDGGMMKLMHALDQTMAGLAPFAGMMGGNNDEKPPRDDGWNNGGGEGNGIWNGGGEGNWNGGGGDWGAGSGWQSGGMPPPPKYPPKEGEMVEEVPPNYVPPNYYPPKDGGVSTDPWPKDAPQETPTGGTDGVTTSTNGGEKVSRRRLEDEEDKEDPEDRAGSGWWGGEGSDWNSYEPEPPSHGSGWHDGSGWYDGGSGSRDHNDGGGFGLPMNISRLFHDMLAPLRDGANGYCFHFANNLQCKYGSTVQVVFQNPNMPSTTNGGGVKSGSKDGSGSDSGTKTTPAPTPAPETPAPTPSTSTTNANTQGGSSASTIMTSVAAVALAVVAVGLQF